LLLRPEENRARCRPADAAVGKLSAQRHAGGAAINTVIDGGQGAVFTPPIDIHLRQPRLLQRGDIRVLPAFAKKAVSSSENATRMGSSWTTSTSTPLADSPGCRREKDYGRRAR
jgi:hypothetical protein